MVDADDLQKDIPSRKWKHIGKKVDQRGLPNKSQRKQ